MIGVRDSDEALGNFLLMLRTRGFRGQALLNAIERAPRVGFVAPEHVGFAYQNVSLPLPCGQETGRALAIVGAVAALSVERAHHVLEIGTGSGWQTAIIADLCRAVASIERWETLAEIADERLERLGYRNAVICHGDGAGGLPDAAPFDRIIFNVAVAAPPAAVVEQLAEGGILLAPIHRASGQVLTRFTRVRGRLAQEELGPSDLPVLVSGVGVNI